MCSCETARGAVSEHVASYRATGFCPIPLFGEYLRSPETSICLGKELAGDAGDRR